MSIRIKRIYEPASKSDGMRILIDRIWPRGMTKDDARVDLWLKDVAPTTALRRWFDHRPERWADFSRRYVAELAENEAVDELREALKTRKPITLLYAARDEEHNHALVLARYLTRKRARESTGSRRSSSRSR